MSSRFPPPPRAGNPIAAGCIYAPLVWLIFIGLGAMAWGAVDFFHHLKVG